MSESVVGVYTIGQTPRPDLTEELTRRFPAVRFHLVGVLDGMAGEQIPACPPRCYPLETRLADGARVVVDAAFVEPLLQRAIDDLDEEVCAHLVLCAGHFPHLEAPPGPGGASSSPRPTLVPFAVAARKLREHGLRRLDVMVPFSEQAGPALDKWADWGFACRAHVFAEKPRHRTADQWLSRLVGLTRAQALVFDYVGFPTALRGEVAAELDVPVYDLGQLALDALEEILDTL